MTTDKKHVPSRAERRRLTTLDAALRYARAHLGADVTAQRLLILTNVSLHEGLSQNELLDLLDATSVTALSRNLADLSVLTTKKTKGPGLIELRPDPLNLRKKRIFLTKKGRKLVASWTAVLASS